MSRVLAVVEGQTEQAFVRDLLAPSLAARGVYLSARVVGRPGHKGGDCRYSRVRRDMLVLLRQESDAVVTTMFDFYALPNSWPGRTKAKRLPHNAKAASVESAVKEDITSELGTSFDPSRFCPYIQMHEFESLLFSSPQTVCEVLRSPGSANEIQAIRDEFESPEEINDNAQTAPSKRLLQVFGDYRKRLHGLIAAKKMGLEIMRDQCPHFAQWITLLESMGGQEADG